MGRPKSPERPVKKKTGDGGRGYDTDGFQRFWGMRPPGNHQLQHVTPQANARCRKGDPKTSVLGTTYLCRVCVLLLCVLLF